MVCLLVRTSFVSDRSLESGTSPNDQSKCPDARSKRPDVVIVDDSHHVWARIGDDTRTTDDVLGQLVPLSEVSASGKDTTLRAVLYRLNLHADRLMIAPVLILLVCSIADPVTNCASPAESTQQSDGAAHTTVDRKSTRLNSSHTVISYAVFCLK